MKRLYNSPQCRIRGSPEIAFLQPAGPIWREAMGDRDTGSVGSSSKYRRSFAHSPAAHSLLSGLVPDRLLVPVHDPGGWGPLLQVSDSLPGLQIGNMLGELKILKVGLTSQRF